MSIHRSLASEPRKLTLVVLSLILAASGLAATPSPDKPAEASSPVLVRSLDAQRSSDGGSTRVTFHGNLPLSYSQSDPSTEPWTLTLDGADCRYSTKEVSVGSPQVNRVRLQSIVGRDGRPSTRVEFEGGMVLQRRVRLDGNDLMVELEGPAPAAAQPAAAPGASATSSTEAAPASAEPAVPPAAEAAAEAPVKKTEEMAVKAKSPARKAAKSTGEPMPTTVTIDRTGDIPRFLAAPMPEELARNTFDLTVASGKSLTLDLESPISRVSVTNPSVADAVVVSPQQLLINGVAPGSTSLVLWFKGGKSRNYNLAVQMDTDALASRLKQYFPDQDISVGASKETVILYGTVTRPEIGEKAVKIASDYTGKVVNNLTYPPDGRKQIMLKIMFAEVNKEALTDLSASLTRIDPLNPRGDHEGFTGTGKPPVSGDFIGNPQNLGPNFTFGDAINFYAFNFRDKWAAFITALKTRGLLQVLAEPTLVTADGQKASFLAGGEFPIPIAQAGAGFTSVTVVFKKFGISLDFTPEIRNDETIVLKVAPEVSALDFNNAVVLSGFRIPALTVRRADTEVELKEGQSFAIAGLYSADLTETKKKIPLLGDIPILGYLFKSKNLEKHKTELMVFATPTFVKPLAAGQTPQLPKFEQSFDIDKPKKGAPAETKDSSAPAAATSETK